VVGSFVCQTHAAQEISEARARFEPACRIRSALRPRGTFRLIRAPIGTGYDPDLHSGALANRRARCRPHRGVCACGSGPSCAPTANDPVEYRAGIATDAAGAQPVDDLDRPFVWIEVDSRLPLPVPALADAGQLARALPLCRGRSRWT